MAEFVYLSGKGKWVKLFTPSQWNKYSVKLYLNNPSLSIVLDLKKRGIKNEVGKDDEGYFINLSKPSEIKVNGQARALPPPVVIDNEEQPWNRDKAIGDDSDLICKVRVRSYKVPLSGASGTAIRLESVKVVHHVPWKKENWPEEEKKSIDGLGDQQLPPF